MPSTAVFAFVAGQTAPPAVFAVGHNGLGLGARVVTVFALARLVAPGLIALGVQGVAALLRVDRVQVPLMDGERMLCGAGYDWLQLAPQGERWWCTAFFRPDGQLEQLYFDITRGNALNGPDSHFEDLFLDVVAEPDGRVFRLDEAELRAAVDAGLVSSAEAARARADADALEARLRAGFPALCALLGRVRAERIPELCAPQTRF